MSTLDGKTALVTGASSGIGRASALRLARAGARVVLAARREDRLSDLATEIEERHHVPTLAVPTDVTDETQVRTMVERSIGSFETLDIVVNNAGLPAPGTVEETSTSAYRTMMEVNVDGTFFTVRETLPHLRKTDGNLIFIGSYSGLFPRPNNSLYAASKWWVRGFAHSVAATVGGDGVGVTVVNPTEVRTDIGTDEKGSLKDRYEPGEITEPDTVANAVVFAAGHSPPDTVNEINLFRRDKLASLPS